MPPFKVARFVQTPNGIQSYLERPGAAPSVHKLFGTKAEAIEAMAAAQAQGWNIVHEAETLNNSIRTGAGLNTGATANLNDTQINRHYPPAQPVNSETPIQAIANQLAVEDWGAAQSYKNNLSPIQVNRNYYNPSPNLDVLIQDYRLPKQPLHENFEYAVKGRDRYRYESGSWVSDDGATYQDYINAANNAPRPMQYSPESLDYARYEDGLGAVETKLKWGTINKRPGYYPGSVLEDPKYSNAVHAWNQRIIQKKSGFVPSNNPSLPDRFVPGRIIMPEKSKRVLLDLKQPQSQDFELLNERQSLTDLEYKQRYGMSLGNAQDLTFDTKLGMTELGNGGWIVRPQNQNQQLGEAFNPMPIQMQRLDVERGVGGVSDYRLQPASNRRVQSDSYPMAPLWAREPRIAQAIPLPVPTREEAIASARDNNKAARAVYRAEQQALINQRPGSFNIVTEPEYIETFAPADPASDIIPGVYSKGKPFQVEVDGNGYVADLPNNLDVHIPGMGYFPVTRGRTLERIPLSSLEPPAQLNADGTFEMQHVYKSGNPVKTYSLPDDTYERDGNVPYMMDALQGLQSKERVTQQAWADFQASLNSPTVSEGVVYAKQRRAAIHQEELEAAQKAYQSALNILEPRASSQKTRTTINVPALGDYPDLLRSHGLDIVESTPTGSGIRIQASGYIPVEKQTALSGELSSRLNREQLVLPPDVSLANSYYKAFKDAGILDQALVRGVQWGKNKSGKPTVVDPGTVVGQWEGQRITRGNVLEPTVKEIPTATPAPIEVDPEWAALIARRDRSKAQQANSLIEKLNIKRAERGEPLLAVGNNGQLFHLPHETVSVATPDDISNTVFASAARDHLNNDFESELNLHARLQDAFRKAQENSTKEQNIKLALGNAPVYSSPDPDTRYSNYQNTMPPKKVTVSRPSSNAFEEDLPLLHQTEHPMDRIHNDNLLVRRRVPVSLNPGSNRFDLSAMAAELSPVVRPSTVDLNQIPETADVQAVPVVNTPHYFRTGIPIEGDDAAWVYNRPSRVTPEVSREIYSDLWHEVSDRRMLSDVPSERTAAQYPAAPQPQPIMVQDPANTWNRYIPAAAALGGLGLGLASGYAIAPRQSEEKEQLRQQLMQQQMYLQQIRQGRR